MADQTTSTLQKCKKVLEEVVSELQESESSTLSKAKGTSTPEVRSSSVQSEHKRLFGYNPRGGAINARYKRFGKGHQSSKPALQPKKKVTWTRNFVCLASTEDISPPNSSKSVLLRKAGLGEKKVILEVEWGPKDVDRHLKEIFPKLQNAGGYCLLKTRERGARFLNVINGPYSVEILKDIMGQGRVYIRPIQSDLDLSPIESALAMQEDLMEKCNVCSKLFYMSELQSHIQSCSNADATSCGINDKNNTVESTPNIEVLKEMFPKSDDEELQCIYEQNSQSLEAAITELLSKSDEEISFNPSHFNTAPLHCENNSGGDYPKTTATKSKSNLDEYFTEKYGQGVKSTQDCPRCCHQVQIQSAGTYISQSGCTRIYSEDEAFSCPNCFYPEEVGTSKDGTIKDGTSKDEKPSLKQILSTLTPKDPTPIRLSVRRDVIVSDSIAVFKRRDYDFNKSLNIQFENEPAVDGGGPRREYFTLLLQSLISPTTPVRLFEGKDAILQPVHNIDALRASMFKVAGRMISASIINGGPPFPYFSPAVYRYWTSNNDTSHISAEVTKDDVVDHEILEAIDKIDGANADNIDMVYKDLLPLLAECGFAQVLSAENKLEAIATLCAHSAILSRKAEIDQFAIGLAPVLGLAKEHPDIMKPLFVYNDEMASTISPENFKALLVFEEVDEKVKEYFLDYIDKEASRLPDLLMFCTGTPKIPPLGFNDPEKITVMQLPPEQGPLPNANTCPQELELPSMHNSFIEFMNSMNTALDNQSTGFGIV